MDVLGKFEDVFWVLESEFYQLERLTKCDKIYPVEILLIQHTHQLGKICPEHRIQHILSFQKLERIIE